MKTVRLMTCNDAVTAHILQGALENEGIESVLHNENFSSLMKSFVSNIAGVDIFVAEEDYERAIEVLRDNQSWPEDLTLCPYCGSSDIKLVLKEGKKMRALGSGMISVFTAITVVAAPPGDNHWEYVCNQCHKKFEKPVSNIQSEEEKEE